MQGFFDPNWNYLCNLFSPLVFSPETSSYCSNGLEGIEGSNSATGDTVCCPTGCGQCGGDGCNRNAFPKYTNKDCCVGGVVRNQGNCADKGAAPCVITGRCIRSILPLAVVTLTRGFSITYGIHLFYSRTIHSSEACKVRVQECL